MSRPQTGRSLVICLDGTRNEPERGSTNVARMFQLAVKDDPQLVYYDPGVGTMGARSATTRLRGLSTQVAGLVLGHGVRENIEEAYTFLMQHYRAGDRVFVFGFSRGAYTARALTGLLRTVGLLRPGAENLVPYAVKLYARPGRGKPSADEEKAYWAVRGPFADNFGNPDFPDRFDHSQIHFLGLWDTVKSVGWFNWHAQLEQARWPFTRKVPNVWQVRHAIALDECRRPYYECRFEAGTEPERLLEMWFAGVHSDVGGMYADDHQLSDIVLGWMVAEAVAEGLRVDPKSYLKLVGAEIGTELPADPVTGAVHPNRLAWGLLGWHRRVVRPGDGIHPSVHHRVSATAGGPKPYRPELAAQI